MRLAYPLICLSLLSQVALAQVENPAATPQTEVKAEEPAQKPAEEKSNKSTDAKSNRQERVQVTGSRIKQIDVATAVPLTTYSRKDIERSGQTTVADFIRNSIPSGSTTSEGNTLSQSNGGASFGGRDFDASYTLVLVNGRRLPSNAISNDNVDLNLIPLAAVERIEYLTDGASAVYGSDAVAGVLNIITRKNFTGTDVTARAAIGTTHKDGVETSLQIVSGVEGDRSNFLIAGDIFKREAVQSKDRPLQSGSIAPDGTDGRSPTGFPGFVQRTVGKNSEIRPYTDCPPESIGTDKKCYFDTAPLYEALPRTERNSIYTIFDHQLTDGVKFSGEARYSRTKSRIRNGAAPGTITLTGAEWNLLPTAIKELSPFYDPANPGAQEPADARISINRRFVEFGPRASVALNETFSTVGALSGDILSGINWEFSIARHKLKNLQYGTDGNLDSVKVIDKFKKGVFNPFVLNEFDTAEKLQAREDVVVETFRLGESNLDVYTLAFDGELPFSLGGGPAGFATGLEFRKDGYFDQADSVSQAGTVIGSAGGVGGGGQETKAAYAEFGLPILKNLDLKTALRNDTISNSKGEANTKGTTTYHAGLSYSPVQSLKLRTSYGTGFKPAPLHDRFQTVSAGVTRAVDMKYCEDRGIAAEACPLREIRSRSGGNPSLEPEKTIYYNIGTVVQALDSLSFSLDYWHLEIKDKIDTLTVQYLLNNEGLFGDRVRRNPATGDFDEEGYYVNTQLQNLNTEESAGLEFGTNYAERFTLGRVESTLKVNKLLVSKSQETPTDPQCEHADEQKGVNGTLSLDFLTSSYTAGSSVRYYGPYETSTGGVEQGSCRLKNPGSRFRVKSYAELGLNAGFKAPFGTTFGLGMQNVTNAQPAFDRNVNWPWYNRSRFNNMGRTLYVSLNHSFK